MRREVSILQSLLLVSANKGYVLVLKNITISAVLFLYFCWDFKRSLMAKQRHVYVYWSAEQSGIFSLHDHIAIVL